MNYYYFHIILIIAVMLFIILKRKPDKPNNYLLKIINVAVIVGVLTFITGTTINTYKHFQFLTNPRCELKKVVKINGTDVFKFTIPKFTETETILNKKTEVHVPAINKNISLNLVEKYSKFGVKIPH